MMITPKRTWLPIAGIVAFSLCSVNAIANLFFAKAKHDTVLFWLAAVLVELCTAWLVWSIVETARKLIKARNKGDRRFYSMVLSVFMALSVPSLSASIIANTIEFGGNVLLGLLFPTLSVGCAVGAALPDVVHRQERAREEEKQEEKQHREELRRKREEAKQIQERVHTLGPEQRTLAQLQANPAQTQAQIAAAIGKSATTVRNDLKALEEVGAIMRKNGKVEVLWQK